jgi:hypothetical protein
LLLPSPQDVSEMWYCLVIPDNAVTACLGFVSWLILTHASRIPNKGRIPNKIFRVQTGRISIWTYSKADIYRGTTAYMLVQKWLKIYFCGIMESTFHWEASSWPATEETPQIYGTGSFFTVFTTAATSSCPEANECSSHHYILVLYDSFWYYRPLSFSGSMFVCSFHIPLASCTSNPAHPSWIVHPSISWRAYTMVLKCRN